MTYLSKLRSFVRCHRFLCDLDESIACCEAILTFWDGQQSAVHFRIILVKCFWLFIAFNHTKTSVQYTNHCIMLIRHRSFHIRKSSGLANRANNVSLIEIVVVWVDPYFKTHTSQQTLYIVHTVQRKPSWLLHVKVSNEIFVLYIIQISWSGVFKISDLKYEDHLVS